MDFNYSSLREVSLSLSNSTIKHKYNIKYRVAIIKHITILNTSSILNKDKPLANITIKIRMNRINITINIIPSNSTIIELINNS